MDVENSLTFFPALYGVVDNPETGMMMFYLTIVVLTIIVYQLGFAKKLPILQNVVVYAVLALGCTLLTFLGIFLPIAEGLVIAAVFLGGYKIRLRQHQKEEEGL